MHKLIDFAALLSKYKALSFRERALVLMTLFAFTWGVWISTFGGMLIDEKSQATGSLSNITNQLHAKSAQLAQMRVSSRDNVVIRLRAERDELIGELDFVEHEVNDLLDKFIAPKQVPLLLEDVLREHTGLTLASLRSQPSQKVTLILGAGTQKNDGSQSLQQHGTGEGVDAVVTPQKGRLEVYRHPFRIELRGAFVDIVAYLDALENGQWQFAWRQLEYVVDEYPNAVVAIEIETLSENMEWIGV